MRAALVATALAASTVLGSQVTSDGSLKSATTSAVTSSLFGTTTRTHDANAPITKSRWTETIGYTTGTWFNGIIELRSASTTNTAKITQTMYDVLSQRVITNAVPAEPMAEGPYCASKGICVLPPSCVVSFPGYVSCFNSREDDSTEVTSVHGSETLVSTFGAGRLGARDLIMAESASVSPWLSSSVASASALVSVPAGNGRLPATETVRPLYPELGCVYTEPSSFAMAILPVGQGEHRLVKPTVHTTLSANLVHISNGILYDQDDKVGYIAVNNQLMFSDDIPTTGKGAGAWAVCGGVLTFEGSDLFCHFVDVQGAEIYRYTPACTCDECNIVQLCLVERIVLSEASTMSPAALGGLPASDSGNLAATLDTPLDYMEDAASELSQGWQQVVDLLLGMKLQPYTTGHELAFEPEIPLRRDLLRRQNDQSSTSSTATEVVSVVYVTTVVTESSTLMAEYPVSACTSASGTIACVQAFVTYAPPPPVTESTQSVSSASDAASTSTVFLSTVTNPLNPTQTLVITNTTELNPMINNTSIYTEPHLDISTFSMSVIASKMTSSVSVTSKTLPSELPTSKSTTNEIRPSATAVPPRGSTNSFLGGFTAAATSSIGHGLGSGAAGNVKMPSAESMVGAAVAFLLCFAVAWILL
ncbi:hypothetical protein BAUCODRAFT_26986 [Baudoinia panamericana UAMH 10762]|uniref:Uncharacterized protein n=1 Tax=Baudoinia panamericana (strain UAMH 10762) TaxID=717646 RepID=M2N122_BAUPA|nr:uncharacterized protein BAUCODRAFT_26986 [Baudoinia panamericana UAMH 10762]EMC92614.1 hypothetical protein BAUCODRAFT_26986 [Baudoinia panamericana UAMH 10762]